jgi:hypothetical protein
MIRNDRREKFFVQSISNSKIKQTQAVLKSFQKHQKKKRTKALLCNKKNGEQVLSISNITSKNQDIKVSQQRKKAKRFPHSKTSKKKNIIIIP